MAGEGRVSRYVVLASKQGQERVPMGMEDSLLLVVQAQGGWGGFILRRRHSQRVRSQTVWGERLSRDGGGRLMRDVEI